MPLFVTRNRKPGQCSCQTESRPDVPGLVGRDNIPAERLGGQKRRLGGEFCPLISRPITAELQLWHGFVSSCQGLSGLVFTYPTACHSLSDLVIACHQLSGITLTSRRRNRIRPTFLLKKDRRSIHLPPPLDRTAFRPVLRRRPEWTTALNSSDSWPYSQGFAIFF